MFKTVSTYLDMHPEVWSGIPAALTAVTDLNSAIQEIDTAVQNQEDNLEGITTDKQNLRDALEAQILIVGGAVYAYAKSTGNEELAALVYYTPSDLDKASEQRVDDAAQRVIDAATNHLIDLADYGVIQADIDTLTSRVIAYDQGKSQHSSAEAIQSGITDNLPQMFRDTVGILNDRLDQLLLRYRFTDPAFHSGYESARVIVDLRGPSPAQPEPVPTPEPEPQPQP